MLEDGKFTYKITRDELDRLMKAGCPCGNKSGGSNFYAFAGDYNFYCNPCRSIFHEQFKKDLEEHGYDKEIGMNLLMKQ